MKKCEQKENFYCVNKKKVVSKMIVGDPYRFAIDMQKIEEWNFNRISLF